MLKHISLFLILITSCQVYLAQTPDSIPFTLTTSNNILVPAVLNQTDTLELMFHTGVSSVSLTKDAVKKISSLNLDQTETVKSWGGETEARYSLNNSLQIGQQIQDSLLVTESDLSGKGSDGKFGCNFFGNHLVEINFDKSLLILHSVYPEKAGDYEKLALKMEGELMFLEAVLQVKQKRLSQHFLIHSGYGGSILLDDDFVQKHEIAQLLAPISESELRDSYGNIIKVKKMLLPELILGESSFANIPVGLFEGALGQQKISVLGGDMLKRFNFIIDRQDGSLYLMLNSLAGVAYNDSK